MKTMEDESPCINCLCVPVCKNKMIEPLIDQCNLVKQFFKEFQWQVPRASYRVLHMHELDRTYEIKCNEEGECFWIYRRSR